MIILFLFSPLNIAIESLSDKNKRLFECFYYKGMNWDEIAINLGYSSAASARNQKYKCLEKIRKTLNVEVG